MSFVPISADHQSPYELTPVLSQKQLNTGTWGTGGNVCVITNGKIHLNSDVSVKATGSTPPNGIWSQSAPAEGSITVYSSSAENSALPIQYVVY